MRLHISHACVVGFAIALGVTSASGAGAQDSTKKADSTHRVTDSTKKAIHRRATRRSESAVSSTRIKVSKETSGGEVMTRAETTAVAPPAPTPAPPPPPPDTMVTPPPTPTPAPPPPPDTTASVTTTTTSTSTTTSTQQGMVRQRSLGQFYFGLGAGGSVPVDNLRNGYGTGWNATVPIGWDSRTLPLGVRVDLGYDRLKGRSSVGVTGDLANYSANLDGKVRLGSFLSHFYGLAGVGASRLVGYGSMYGPNGTSATGTYGTTTSNPTTNSSTNTYNGTYPNGAPNVATSFGDAKTEFSWNAGGGFEYGVKHTSLFVESRYFHVNTSSTLGANTRFVPLIVGVTFH